MRKALTTFFDRDRGIFQRLSDRIHRRRLRATQQRTGTQTVVGGPTGAFFFFEQH